MNRLNVIARITIDEVPDFLSRTVIDELQIQLGRFTQAYQDDAEKRIILYADYYADYRLPTIQVHIFTENHSFVDEYVTQDRVDDAYALRLIKALRYLSKKTPFQDVIKIIRGVKGR